MNFHAAASGNGRNGSTTNAQTHEPATTDAVSSIGSPPGAPLTSAFHPACSMPARRTASVMPSVSSWAGTTVSGASSCGLGLALLPGAAVAERRNEIGLRYGGRRDRLVGLEARPREHAGFLEDRVGDRADVRIDPAQIGDQVEMQRRRLDAFDGVARKASEVRVRVSALEITEQHLLREQFLRLLEIAVEEHRKPEPQVRDQSRMQIADLRHAGLGEVAPLVDLLVFEIGQDALDDVADLFHVDRRSEDVGPAPAFALLERFARNLREI